MINIRSEDTFYEQVEDLVWQHDINYIDAIVMFCETNNLEIESVTSLILKNENLKSKLADDAEILNYLPKTSKLPI